MRARREVFGSHIAQAISLFLYIGTMYNMKHFFLSGTLGGGPIAGIVISILLALGLVVVGVLFYRRRSNNADLGPAVSFENASYSYDGNEQLTYKTESSS